LPERGPRPKARSLEPDAKAIAHSCGYVFRAAEFPPGNPANRNTSYEAIDFTANDCRAKRQGEAALRKKTVNF